MPVLTIKGTVLFFVTYQALLSPLRYGIINLSPFFPLDTIPYLDTHPKIDYHGLLKTSTSFKVEPSSAEGSTLVVTDDYSGTDEAERLQRLDEVDRSLIQWGRDLRRYLSSWKHWSWLPPWRWYMRRVWQPMKPSARRITCWLLWLSLGELALIFLLIAILAIEY